MINGHTGRGEKDDDGRKGTEEQLSTSDSFLHSPSGFNLDGYDQKITITRSFHDGTLEPFDA
jgi:hypothetical protein